ncbi:MAG: hypothetical protein V9E83_14720 [Baekduia sp.]
MSKTRTFLVASAIAVSASPATASALNPAGSNAFAGACGAASVAGVDSTGYAYIVAWVTNSACRVQASMDYRRRPDGARVLEGGGLPAFPANGFQTSSKVMNVPSPKWCVTLVIPALGNAMSTSCSVFNPL